MSPREGSARRLPSDRADTAVLSPDRHTLGLRRALACNSVVRLYNGLVQEVFEEERSRFDEGIVLPNVEETDMRTGREYLQEVNRAINKFEDAIVHRENKKLLESKVTLQQDADRTRKNLVETVVKIVTEQRMAKT